MPIEKQYMTVCTRQLADGTVKTYAKKGKYMVKDPKFTPEDVEKIKELIALRVPKKFIAEQYHTTYPTLMKWIK